MSEVKKVVVVQESSERRAYYQRRKEEFDRMADARMQRERFGRFSRVMTSLRVPSFGGAGLLKTVFLLIFFLNIGFALQGQSNIFSIAWFLQVLSNAPSIPMDWLLLPPDLSEIPVIGDFLRMLVSSTWVLLSALNVLIFMLYIAVNIVFIGG